jgi:S-DNA-T family DNA segregation ATPase FtsK/SpoIIIE
MSLKRKKRQSLQVIKSRSTQVAAKTNKPEEDHSFGLSREIYALVFGFIGLFLVIAMFNTISGEKTNSMGLVGESISKTLFGLLGFPSLLVPILAFGVAHSYWSKKVTNTAIFGGRLFLISLGLIVFSFSCSAIAAVIGGAGAGGAIGDTISFYLTGYFSSSGALLISFATAIVSFINTTRISSSVFLRGLSKTLSKLMLACSEVFQALISFCYLTFVKLFTGKSSNSKINTNTSNIVSIEKEDTQGNWSLDGKTIRARKKQKTVTEDELEDQDYTIINDKNSNDRNSNKKEIEDYSNPLISRRSYDDYLNDKKKKSESKVTNKIISNDDFSLPPLDLLVRSDSSLSTSPKDNELIENSRKLEIALENFKITGKIVEVHPGPVVTLYQFEPGAGVKVQRVISLADDLALSLKVASVRVYAPVPGKGTVGIEVPNSQREIVRLREIIDADDFKSTESPLLLALGKDTYGSPYVADLSKMPHLLIAGATGTGKSVCINSILLSLLYKNTPDQLRLIMIDPKMLELSVYEDIPHLNAPVVTNPKHARAVLWWAVEEMEKRYELMKLYGVRNIAMYNRLVEEKVPAKKDSIKGAVVELEEKDVIATRISDPGLTRDVVTDSTKLRPQVTEALPKIVIVVDELADLMLTVGREIEELLTRLAQKARASGIHLILATQRPSVNVITGLIKANFPARISFKVASRIDARTVMDTSGAEKLLGQGDMLFMSPSVGRVLRLHSPFVSDQEVNDVVHAIRAQGAPRYDQGIEKTIKKLEENERPDGVGGEEEYDEYYDQAVQLVVEKGQASTSMVQRAFRIGYNRAARILEVMEREGVVGPADGARPRQVLISDLI